MDIKKRTVLLPILYILERDYAQAPENVVEIVYSRCERLDKIHKEVVGKTSSNPFLNDYDRQRLAIQEFVDVVARENGWDRQKTELVEDEVVLARMLAIEKSLIKLKLMVP